MAYVVKWYDKADPRAYLASMVPEDDGLPAAAWAAQQRQAIRFDSRAQAWRLMREWMGKHVWEPGQIRLVRLKLRSR